MLLRIIGNQTPEQDKESIQIVFESNTFSKSFPAEYFPSPLSTNYKKTLEWSYKDFLSTAPADEGDRDVIEKLIRLGKNMGGRLLGDDLELVNIQDIIEKEGYQNLSVQIESPRVEFFEEIWEALILHESNFLLSAVANGFVRKLTDGSDTADGSRKAEGSQNADDSHTTPESDAAMDYALSKESPLKILHVIFQEDTEQSHMGHAFGTSVDLLTLDGAVDYEIWPAFYSKSTTENPADDLKARLLSKDNAIHILIYDGILNLDDKAPGLPSLAGLAGEAGISCLVLPAADYRENGQELSANTGLTRAAGIALTHGIPNVLGIGNQTDPWTAALCFTTVFKSIAAGFSLSQAIVEARKSLQSILESQTFSAKPTPFQIWPLLQHFESRKVQFFGSPQAPTELLQSEKYGEIRQKLHGFQSEYLPPHEQVYCDNALPEALDGCLNHSAIIISGDEGSGKTHLTHMLAFYLLQKNRHYGFYFDYRAFSYHASDICDMIAPLLSAENSADVPEKLKELPSLFIFDNIQFLDRERAGEDAKEEPAPKLLELMRKLLNQGHILVLTGDSPELPLGKDLSKEIKSIALKPLPLPEQKRIAAQVLRENNFADETMSAKTSGDDYSELLERLAGNPYLLKKTLPLLQSNSPAELSKKVKENFQHAGQGNIVELFYEWQWKELDTIWRRWLLILTDLPEVLLEMLGLACERRMEDTPAAALFTLLGNNKVSYQDGIRLLQTAGFLLLYPHGRVLSPRCSGFLKEKRTQDKLFTEEASSINLLVSQVVSEAVGRTIQYTQKQPQPAISQNLLVNRGMWAKHIEQLWLAKDYGRFYQTLTLLGGMLRQNKLDAELSVWSKELLERSEKLKTVDPEQTEYMISYLHLASSSLAAPDAKDDSRLKKTALLFREWLDGLDAAAVKQHSALFFHALEFLGLFYPIHKDWPALLSANQIAHREYRTHEVWPQLAAHLKTLAEVSFIMGQTEQGLAYERELLEELPLDKFPPEFKTQSMITMIFGHINRKALENAQALLDELKKSEQAKTLAPLIKTLQADIFYKAERLTEAAELYCQLWLQASQPGKSGEAPVRNGEYVGAQLIQIEKDLGAEEFAKIYAAHAGPEIARPIAQAQVPE